MIRSRTTKFVEWLKQPGDRVTMDEDLAEISTDKVDAPVPCPVEGVLHVVLRQRRDGIAIALLVAGGEERAGDKADESAGNEHSMTSRCWKCRDRRR